MKKSVGKVMELLIVNIFGDLYGSVVPCNMVLSQPSRLKMTTVFMIMSIVCARPSMLFKVL